MGTSWEDAVKSFSDAAEWFAETITRVGERWSEPGLGEWDIRALVGHTSRALLTVETYLAQPAESVAIPSAADYYLATRAIAGGSAVVERGRQAGVRLGEHPAAAVAEIVGRVVPLLRRHDGTQLVTTAAGGMRLIDYLPTRTFELAVHTTDLCTALGIVPSIPGCPARQALHLVTDLALRARLDAPLLLAATGRTGLPTGFSVL